MLQSINQDPRFLKHLVSLKLFSDANKKFFFIDVGAANGVHSMWDVFGAELKGLGFEPDTHSYQRIPKSDRVTYENFGLGSADSTSNFFLSAHPQNSGSFAQDLKFLNRLACFDYQGPEFLESEETSIEIRSFESYAKQHEIDGIDFIKLDTEGMELEALRGFGNLLDTALGVQTEVFFCEMHLGRPLFKDIDAYLQEKGFTLFDLELFRHAKKALPPLNSTGDGAGQITSGEALYLRDFVKAGDISKQDPLTILKMISLYELFAQNDSAVELFQHAHEAGLFEGLDISHKIDLLVPFVESIGMYVSLADYLNNYVPKEHSLLKIRNSVMDQDRDKCKEMVLEQVQSVSKVKRIAKRIKRFLVES